MPRKTKASERRSDSVPALSAGVPMAEQVRRFDWSRTPLGPMDRWPTNLRMAVEAALNSTTPALVWWGPQLINIYNDAHIPVAKDRHPAGLGQPAPKVWADVWELGFAKDVDGVMKRGVPVIRNRVRFDVDRGAYLEERYFTYSLAPVADGEGGIGGLILIGVEETAMVFAERERDREQALERRRLEIAAQDARAVAEANLARWQAVIAGMSEGVILSDAQGNLIDWNRSALDMYEYPDLAAARQNLANLAGEFQVRTLDGQVVPVSRWPMARLLRGEIITDLTLRVRRAGMKRELTIAYSGTQIRDREGQVILALLTLHEVSAGPASPAAVVARQGETEEQRMVRFADEVAENVEAMLHNMDLTHGEREFTTTVGAHLVDEAIDAYMRSTQEQKGYNGSCIAAAIAVAFMIVNDAD